MDAKTKHGTKITILAIGKTHSKVQTKDGRIIPDMCNQDIVWPETEESKQALNKIINIIDKPKNQKNKKECINSQIENQITVSDSKPQKQEKDTNLNSNRIKWLEQAYNAINEALFDGQCPHSQISWSFSPKNAKTAYGCAMSSLVDTEDKHLIVISPKLSDTMTVLETLTHEMIHIYIGVDQGHRKAFTQKAKSLGFDKPYSKHNPTEKLKNSLKPIYDKLGNIPPGHVEFSENTKKQSTRQRKYTCPGCDQIIRAGSDNLNVICGICEVNFEKVEE